MTRISWREAVRLGLVKPEEVPKEEKHKYNARKTEVNGIVFASQKEANYYAGLLLLQRAGEVTEIELQPRFLLKAGFKRGLKRIRPIYYVADFRVTYKDGHQEVVDVKSSAAFQTQVYRLKKKLLLDKYPEIDFREVY